MSSSSSSSSMSITHYCLVFLTLVLISQNTVQANRTDLVPPECGDAKNPEICYQCLQSYHPSENNDPKNITANIIDCANKRVTNLVASFNSLLFIKHDNVTLLAIKDCIKLHIVARASLLTAFSKLITLDWVGAHVGVLTAAASLIKCHLELDAGKSNFKLPGKVLYEMNAAEQLTDAAKRVVEQQLSN